MTPRGWPPSAARPRPCSRARSCPRSQDFKTVGHLYRSIEAGIAHLADKFGERRLFVGPPRAQATQQYFRWPELVAVTDAGQRATGHRRDPRAGRGQPRALEGLALRPVRRHPRRVHPAPRGQPGLRPGPPGGHGQRQAQRARHRGPAGHRPADQAGHGPVQRQLRGPAAHAAALLRPHRGDRRPAQGAGRRHRQPDVPGHQAARRPGHHAPGRPGVPGPHGRPELRAVLRVRHCAAAPRGRLDPAHRAPPPGRRVLRARRAPAPPRSPTAWPRSGPA